MRTVLDEFLRNRALMFLAGVVTLPAGLAIVLTHNVWVADWRVLITVVGWLAAITGAFRIIAPQDAIKFGRHVYDQPNGVLFGAAVWIAIGAILFFFGYAQYPPRRGKDKKNTPFSPADLVTPKVTTGPIVGSRKIYTTPEAAADLRVPFREIALDPSAKEPPVRVYDSSGIYTDDNAGIDVEQGLKRIRAEWVRERGGIEEYEGRPIKPVDNGNVTGKHLARNFPNTPKPMRASSLPSPLWGGSASEASRGGG